MSDFTIHGLFLLVFVVSLTKGLVLLVFGVSLTIGFVGCTRFRIPACKVGALISTVLVGAGFYFNGYRLIADAFKQVGQDYRQVGQDYRPPGGEAFAGEVLGVAFLSISACLFVGMWILDIAFNQILKPKPEPKQNE
jgi:hypothetical protein